MHLGMRDSPIENNHRKNVHHWHPQLNGKPIIPTSDSAKSIDEVIQPSSRSRSRISREKSVEFLNWLAAYLPPSYRNERRILIDSYSTRICSFPTLASHNHVPPNHSIGNQSSKDPRADARKSMALGTDDNRLIGTWSGSTIQTPSAVTDEWNRKAMTVKTKSSEWNPKNT
jgi:hypothetical protein